MRGGKCECSKWKRAACAARALIRLRHLLPQREKERPNGSDYFSFAAFFSSSALSVFSHENSVALCFLPAPSV